MGTIEKQCNYVTEHSYCLWGYYLNTCAIFPPSTSLAVALKINWFKVVRITYRTEIPVLGEPHTRNERTKLVFRLSLKIHGLVMCASVFTSAWCCLHISGFLRHVHSHADMHCESWLSPKIWLEVHQTANRVG